MASLLEDALPGGIKHENSARESQDRADGSEKPLQRLNGYTTASYFPQQPTSNTNTLDPQQRTESPSGQRGRPSTEQQQNGTFQDKPRTNGSKRTSKTTRICGKCGQGLTGQFVRALEDTFHLECFTCHDCGKIVASKFFPESDHPPNQYPLCETDYFRRLNLLCYECGSALRGSYITALERKYHIEHFTCSVCPTVFGARDSYYEHEGSVYCHYHYSTKFAQQCNGCQTAILKQFVEIFRNGQNQHWHPECYMIHKFWNVRLHSPDQPVKGIEGIDGDASDRERKRVRVEEEMIEKKVLWIWSTLSAYEERSASCISQMLFHVSNGAYVDSVMAAKKFILYVELLFSAADHLDYSMTLRLSKGLSYSREAKLLCKKVVAFFQLLAGSQDTGVRRSGVTQDLLSLVTGLAHYLKLLIRICLQGALKFEREAGSEQALQRFLEEINSVEAKLDADETIDSPADLASYVQLSADTCPICTRPVEDRCFRHKEKVFHVSCMKCESCQRDLAQSGEGARWDEQDERLLCSGCADEKAYAAGGFVEITRLQQYVHLLRVAHARLLATLRTSSALPHTSDDPNLEKYDSRSGHRVSTTGASLGPPLLQASSRSKSYAGTASKDEQPESTYEQRLGNIRRLRSTRMDKPLSTTLKRARTSRIIDGPEGDSVRPGAPGVDGLEERKSGFRIIQDRDANGEPTSQLTFGNQESIRLDDIPRIVAAEQAKDQRPNATRYARGGLIQSEPQPKFRYPHRRDMSGAQELDKFGPEGYRPKRYFSELSALEYFIVRHVAVLSMEPLLEGYFNQEELLDLIETRKPTFWGKFGKAFKNDKGKGGRKKGVFGVPLDQLVEKDGAESTDGVGPGVLRIPALVQDTIAAMRTMDMSMEGVFRKNGNIRKLKEMAELIDAKGGDAIDLNSESPVQVAALLKRFLRELPDPLMTFKLWKLFLVSQSFKDEEKQRRILHLTCCLLPKGHRDTWEVLACFLNWAASFSVVDDETGSKMDIHNLATVIAPNVLFSSAKLEQMEDSFLAIEAVHTLIECNDAMCEVPSDLQSILNDSSLFSGSADLTTKEILKRYGDMNKPVSGATTGPNDTSSRQESRGSAPVVTHRDDEDPHQASAWQAESSTRPLQQQQQQQGVPATATATTPLLPSGAVSFMQHTPSQQYPKHNGFYANPTTGSRDSFGMNVSPSRQNRHLREPGPSGHGNLDGPMGVT